MFALAFESLFKLVAFLVIGAVAALEVFGSWPGISRWSQLALEPQFQTPPLQPVQWFSLLLMFVSAPLVLPHLFQLLFRETSICRGCAWPAGPCPSICC